MDTQHGIGTECGQQPLGLRVIGEAIDDDANAMALGGQCAGQVRNVPEQPANRCPQDLQHTEAVATHL
ncbi:hypothetical protein D9M68_996660 [compost metagenome]